MSNAHLERFYSYVACFNEGDFDRLRDYYAEDVEIVNGAGVVMRGPDEVFAFYREVRATTQRTIKVLRALADEHHVFAELESEFLATTDNPDFASGPMREGDRLYINTIAVYQVRDGRFIRVRAAVLNREWRRRDDAPST